MDEERHERGDESTKEDSSELEAIGAEEMFVAEDDVKRLLEGFAEVRALWSFVGVMLEMALTMNGER